MDQSQRRSLAIGIRIAGNLLAAGSLIGYALTLDTNPEDLLVPREFMLGGAVLGFCLVLAAIFVGYLPETGRQAEERIRREFENRGAGDE